MNTSVVTSLAPLPSALTHAVADGYLQACLRQIHAVAQAPERVWVLDASSLSSFDSSAIAVCLALRRALTHRSETLQIASAPARLQSLASLYGVRQWFGE